MRAAKSINGQTEKATTPGSKLPNVPSADLVGGALQLLQHAKFSIASMLNTPEKHLPFRKDVLARQMIFGNPSPFLTINTSDIQSPVSFINGMTRMRLIDKLPHLQWPSKADGVRTMFENPLAAAQWFHHIIRFNFQEILAIDTETGVKCFCKKCMRLREE